MALLLVAPTVIGQQPPHNTAADKPIWNQKAKDEVLTSMNRILGSAAYVPGVDFSKWDAALEKVRQKAIGAKDEDQFAGVINTTFHDQFGISHIVLMPPRAVDARVNQKQVGIGVGIAPNPEGLQVTRTVPGAPAEKAGIEPGDIIMEADGHKVDGPTYITGAVGTKVVLKVKKSDGTIKLYTVTRAEFKTSQPEELKWADKDTAVVKIPTFDLSYDRRNVEEIMGQAMNAKNLILDLRNNGGGAVTNMQHLLGLLLPDQTPVGVFINKRLEESWTKEKGGSASDLKGLAEWATPPSKIMSMENKRLGHYKGHIAVLVNGGSGSASEITAITLREQLNAPVVGKKSAGAVLVSIIAPLPRNFNLQFPISDYVSAKGTRLEANGIVPDMESNDLIVQKKGQVDPAWNYAISLLNKASSNGGR